MKSVNVVCNLWLVAIDDFRSGTGTIDYVDVGDLVSFVRDEGKVKPGV